MQQTVCDLLRVISRQASFADAEALLDDGLVVYMDGRRLGSGPDSWIRWVRFLHHNADKKMSGLTLEVERMQYEDNRVRVLAAWRADIKGEPAYSDVGEVVYEVRDNKITSIWTHKKNYVFIYGDMVATSLGFYWQVLRMLLAG